MMWSGVSAIDHWVIEIHLRTVFQVLDYYTKLPMYFIRLCCLGNRPVKTLKLPKHKFRKELLTIAGQVAP
jgi:hypothetical protein